MRSPGFEPGLSGWEPDVLTKLDYDRTYFPKQGLSLFDHFYIQYDLGQLSSYWYQILLFEIKFLGSSATPYLHKTLFADDNRSACLHLCLTL